MMMKRYFRGFIDYEKEEKWINEQSQKGRQLKKVFPFYYGFEEGDSEKYTYRIVLLPKDRQDYLDFLESAGVEIVCIFNKWVYVRRKSTEETFELYTNYASKIIYYKQISHFYFYVLIFNLVAGILNLFLFFMGEGEKSDVNALSSLFNFLVVILLFFTFKKIHRKKKILQQDHGIFAD